MIIFDQVTKQFSPDSYGVLDVSFEVEPGEFVLLTGKSGAGKTTLMRLLTKEYTPTDGSIHFEDADLGDISYGKVHLLRRKIGVVFQDYRLLPELNVWENIALPLSIVGQPEGETEERVTDLLRLIGLPDKASLFPSQLSGGEAQRVSIARALANGPSVIFADEPTGNLDRETSESIGRLLKKINELGTTILFATHDQSVLDLFKKDRRLHMENGKLVKDSQPTKKVRPEAPKHDQVDNQVDDEPSDEPDVQPKTKKTAQRNPLAGFMGMFGKKSTVEPLDNDDVDDHVGKKPEPEDSRKPEKKEPKDRDGSEDGPVKVKVQVKTESLDE